MNIIHNDEQMGTMERHVPKKISTQTLLFADYQLRTGNSELTIFSM